MMIEGGFSPCGNCGSCKHCGACDFCGAADAKPNEPCHNCAATECSECSKRTPTEDAFCVHCGIQRCCGACGGSLPRRGRYCPRCGESRRPTPPPSKPELVIHSYSIDSRPSNTTAGATPGKQKGRSASDAPNSYGPAARASSSTRRELLEVRATEQGMATGRSLLSNLIGEAAIIRCQLEGRASASGTSRVEFVVEFVKFSNDGPIESLSGESRQEAESALEQLHHRALEHGWTPIAQGHSWYSYRYERFVSA